MVNTEKSENFMRIIAGKFRGLKLESLAGVATRPTGDHIKESIFNIIQSHLPCGKVLDLFAGSGSLGLEALSRGAEFAVLVDNNRAAVDVIRRNAARLKLETADVSVVSRDYLSYIKSSIDKFDIIFLDPPYGRGYLAKAVEAIRDCGILAYDGILVIESEVGGESVEFEGFEAIKTKEYGRILVNVLRNM